VRGEGAEAILYMDLGCPHCAASWQRIDALELRLVFRHFPVASKHPRAPALHAAAEAAGLQGEEHFWEMCDSIYRGQGHIDDPHLWQRVETIGLELERFERERRSKPVIQRVQRDFDAGIRAGVIGTPAAVADGRLILRDVAAELASLKASG
jgi:protein-disulfide isomerase